MIDDPSPTSNPNAHLAWADRSTSDRVAGAALCALSAAGFASLTILGKLALQSGLNLVTILGVRFCTAALLLGFFLRIVKGRRLFHGWRVTIPLLLLGSVGYAGQSSLYFASLSRNPASINALLLYVYPVFVALLSWGVNRVSPSRREVGAMIVAIAGVVLTVGVDPDRLSIGPSIDPLGVFLVLASAAWYAVYIIASDRFVFAVGPWVSTTWIALGAGGSFMLAGISTGGIDLSFSFTVALILLGIVLLSTIMALGTFLAGMRRVGPTSASLLSTLEPVFTVILSLTLLHEALITRQWIGGAFVLTAVVLLTVPSGDRI